MAAVASRGRLNSADKLRTLRTMLVAMLRAGRPVACAAARGAAARRSLCNAGDGVAVDMVCRVWSCKVKDDATAHQLDLVFDAFLDEAAQVRARTRNERVRAGLLPHAPLRRRRRDVRARRACCARASGTTS